MNIETIKEEQYTALIIKAEHINSSVCEELKNTVTVNLEKGSTNFILAMNSVKEVDNDFYSALEMIANTLEKEEGYMVLVCNNEEIANKLEENEYITTPTFDEAVDYIFMEEIEKQLRAGDEQKEEWDEE